MVQERLIQNEGVRDYEPSRYDSFFHPRCDLVRMQLRYNWGTSMKLKLFVLAILLFGACSDSNGPASLTFVGVGQPSFDPGAAGTMDVVSPGDTSSIVCSSDDECQTTDLGPCGTSVCSSQGQCETVWKEDGASCDDGDSCTEGESCTSGECGGGENTCPCDTDEDCSGPGFDLCLGNWSCQDNTCQVDSKTAVECDEDLGPCLESLCNPNTGACEEETLEDGLSCDDSDACTGASRCKDGACYADPDSDISCDDGAECTLDSCDPEQGCVYAAKEGSCDDGDVCTLGDTCQDGTCVASEELECTTENQCMNAVCEPTTGCTELPKLEGVACDDGNACTDGDACLDGSCLAGQSICDCETDADCPDDDDLCNGVPTCVANECIIAADSIPQCNSAIECIALNCVPATGECEEEPVPNGTPCVDGLGCTEDSKCAAGACVGTPKLCDDANPCTVDSCDEAVGACVFTALDGPCDDGEPCTLGDKCLNGGCVGGSKDLCPDGDDCTVDSCTEGVGCEWLPVSCDDGNKCTDDKCAAVGGCKNQPKVCDKDDVGCVAKAVHSLALVRV